MGTPFNMTSAVVLVGGGIGITLDPIGLLFFAFSAVVWLVAGLYAFATVEKNRARFFTFFVLAMVGSLGVCLITDPRWFYTFFSIMALSAYALVAHYADPESRRAGRVYMAFTLVGEAVLLSAFFLLLAVPGTSVLTGILMFIAFGMKFGLPGLHGWLPIAHPVAPTPASALLSGVMIKAGVLGPIRFLPGGTPGFEDFGPFVMVIGIFAAFYGVAVGVLQRDPKTVLAYSSISQLGFITVGIGAGIAESALWPLAAGAAAIYAAHHGLSKAALFLGVDVVVRSRHSRLALAALAIPAVALAGLPFTSGSVAKTALKGVTGATPGPWPGILEVALPLAAVGTTVLMARFLYLLAVSARPSAGKKESAVAIFAWITLLVIVLVAPWLWPGDMVRPAAEKALAATQLLGAAWPVLLGMALAAAVWATRSATSRLVGLIPPGDIYAPLFALAHRAVDTVEHSRSVSPKAAEPDVKPTDMERTIFSFIERTLVATARVEKRILGWSAAGTAVAALALLVLALGIG